MENNTVNFLQIYTEVTPNPDALKFACNKMLLPNDSIDFMDAESTSISLLAKELFDLPYVTHVFIANNFVTVTKSENHVWHDVMPEIKELLKNFLESGKEIVDKKAISGKDANKTTEGDSSTVRKIKQLLETRIAPAVEMDGGAIKYRSYQDGVVRLTLQGSCVGCPSAIVTLRSGIEGIMKELIPEVKQVIAEDE